MISFIVCPNCNHIHEIFDLYNYNFEKAKVITCCICKNKYEKDVKALRFFDKKPDNIDLITTKPGT